MSKTTVTQHRRSRHRRNPDRLGVSGWFTLTSLACAYGAIGWAAYGFPVLEL